MLNIHIVEENWLLRLYLWVRHRKRPHHSSIDILKILIIAALKWLEHERMCFCNEAILTDSITHCLCCLGSLMSPSWQLRANTTSSIWIHFKPSASNCRREKNPKLLTKRDHLEAVVGWWELEAWKALGGCGREGRRRKREERGERDSGAATSTKPCRESLSADRTVITGSRRRKPYWGGKRRYSNCWVAALNITATSPSYSAGHERRVPDHCTKGWCQGRGSHGHRRSPRQAR